MTWSWLQTEGVAWESAGESGTMQCSSARQSLHRSSCSSAIVQCITVAWERAWESGTVQCSSSRQSKGKHKGHASSGVSLENCRTNTSNHWRLHLNCGCNISMVRRVCTLRVKWSNSCMFQIPMVNINDSIEFMDQWTVPSWIMYMRKLTKWWSNLHYWEMETQTSMQRSKTALSNTWAQWLSSSSNEKHNWQKLPRRFELSVACMHACQWHPGLDMFVFFQMPLQGMFFLVIQLYSCTITGSCACFHHQGLSLLCSLQWCLNTFTCCSSVCCVGVMAIIVISREMNTQMGNAQLQCKCMCIHFTHKCWCQYTNAMQMHVRAFHTHTHPRHTWYAHACVHVFESYSNLCTYMCVHRHRIL